MHSLKMEEKKDIVELFDSLNRARNKSIGKNIFQEYLQVINHFKTKCEEKSSECDRLQTSLDVAHNKIISLYHQNDEIVGKYNTLLKNNRSSDTTDSETQTETVDKTSNQSKLVESSLKEADQDDTSLLNPESTPTTDQNFIQGNEDVGLLVESQISSSSIIDERKLESTGKKRKRRTDGYNETSNSPLSKELPIIVSEPPCSEDAGYESQFPDTQSAYVDPNSQTESQAMVSVEVGESITHENRTSVILDSSQSNVISTSTICCELCGRFFARKGNLTQHLKVHGPKMFTCTLCDESFRFKYQLTKHVSKPCSRKRYKCSCCNAYFGYMATKRRHEKTFHTEYSKYWCSFCNVSFLTKESLSEHLKLSHSGKTLWKFNDGSSQATQFTV